MTTEENKDYEKRTSTGHAAASSEHLDHHYEMMRPEYERMLLAAGIEAGWRVLDAGAGGGSFLPLMSEQVGASGQIDALDLAPENVAILEQRVASGEFACPVTPQLGSVMELPYGDGEFDLVWCANVTQYLTEEELTKAMDEMARVIRPGGLVVIKEVDLGASCQWAPLDPALLWRFLEAARGLTQVQGVLRPPMLPKWMRGAGLEFVSYETFSAERRPPFEPVDYEFIGTMLMFFGKTAIDQLDLSQADKDQWQRTVDPDADDYLLKDPDFYWRESMGLIVGRKQN